MEPLLTDTRLAKRIARAGLCSRRDAEAWIAAGRVAVNGQVVSTQGVRVHASDRIEVDGLPLPAPAKAQVWALHKPRGVVVTAKDPQGRRSLADLLPKAGPRLMPVGRLDINSEGLILLTNDGELKRRLELPETGLERRYRVRVYGQVSDKALAALREGLEIDGLRYGAITAFPERQDTPAAGQNRWLRFYLKEGKNREVRKVCAHLGLAVNRLVRIAYGPIRLDGLAKGQLEPLTARQLRELMGEDVGAKQGWARAKPKRRKPPRPGAAKASAPQAPRKAQTEAQTEAQTHARAKTLHPSRPRTPPKR